MTLDLDSLGLRYTSQSSKKIFGEKYTCLNLTLPQKLDTLVPDNFAQTFQKRCDHSELPIFDYSIGKITIFPFVFSSFTK